MTWELSSPPSPLPLLWLPDHICTSILGDRHRESIYHSHDKDMDIQGNSVRIYTRLEMHFKAPKASGEAVVSGKLGDGV